MTIEELDRGTELRKDFDLAQKIIDKIDSLPEGVVTIPIEIHFPDADNQEILLSESETQALRTLLENRKQAAVDIFEGL